MKAINQLTKEEYEVYVGNVVDENFNNELVIDFDKENWYVLEEYRYKTIQQGHEYLTYSIEGIMYQGYFTPKYSEILSLAIVIERIKKEFPNIPHDMLKIENSEYSNRNSVVMKFKHLTVSINVFYQFNGNLKEEHYPKYIKTYGYSKRYKESGYSGSCSLDSAMKSLKEDLLLVNIKPVDIQMNIFELLRFV